MNSKPQIWLMERGWFFFQAAEDTFQINWEPCSIHNKELSVAIVRYVASTMVAVCSNFYVKRLPTSLTLQPGFGIVYLLEVFFQDSLAVEEAEAVADAEAEDAALASEPDPASVSASPGCPSKSEFSPSVSSTFLAPFFDLASLGSLGFLYQNAREETNRHKIGRPSDKPMA